MNTYALHLTNLRLLLNRLYCGRYSSTTSFAMAIIMSANTYFSGSMRWNSEHVNIFINT